MLITRGTSRNSQWECIAYLQFFYIPALPPGWRYVDLAVGRFFDLAALGWAFATWGSTNSSTWLAPQPLPWGVYYVEADAGDQWGALRRSDGQIVPFGTLRGAVFAYEAAPLDPGTSYVSVGINQNNIIARVGPTSTYVGIAPGCVGSLPASRLVPRDTPRIGSTLEVNLFDLPVDAALMVFGWQRTQPFDLGALGAPGCSAHVSADAAILLLGQNQQARFELPIPDLPVLVGTRFYNQAVVLDPAAPNALGAVVSDASEGVVGFW